MKVLLSSILFVAFVPRAGAELQNVSESLYRDPRGHFTVIAPAGWNTESLGDEGVKLSRGNAYCNVTHMRGGASGQDIVSQVLGQISAQWKGFSVVDQGEARLAGGAGSFAVGVGANPKGIPGIFRISAVGTGTEALAIVSSVPQSEFASLKADLARIEQTAAFGAGTASRGAAALPSGLAEKLAALETACRAGVFTPEECEARRKTMLGERAESGAPRPASGIAARPAPESPSPASGMSGNPAPRTIRFTRLSVKDPGINNIEAIAFLIPAGWKVEGGIQWFPDLLIQANLLMRISDLQTGAAIEFLPLQNFTWLTQPVVPMQPGTNYLGSILWPPIMDVPQFIQSFYASGTLRHLQNAVVINSQDMPKVAALAAQFNSTQHARAGRVRYEYQLDGRTWEEDVFATLVYAQFPSGPVWSVTGAHSLRAPKGQLDLLSPVMNTTINTGRLSLDWFAQYRYVQKLFTDRMMQGIRNAGILSQTIARNNEEIRQMFAESYRQSCQSQDRIHQSFTEYIRGVETYRNPYEERPVQLPSGYSNVWVSRAGEYALSNEAGFNPNVGSNTEWRRLEKNP